MGKLATKVHPDENIILILLTDNMAFPWEAFTFYYDLQGGFAVLNAMHYFAAVDSRVVGAKVLDFQGGVTGDGWIVG